MVAVQNIDVRMPTISTLLVNNTIVSNRKYPTVSIDVASFIMHNYVLFDQIRDDWAPG